MGASVPARCVLVDFASTSSRGNVFGSCQCVVLRLVGRASCPINARELLLGLAPHCSQDDIATLLGSCSYPGTFQFSCPVADKS